MLNEASPDKEGCVARYGFIEGGDGKHYRVARIGMNERGAKLESLISDFRDYAEEGGDHSIDIAKTARELVTTALEPYYNSSTITYLLDEGVLTYLDLAPIARVASGEDVVPGTEKKSSPEKS